MSKFLTKITGSFILLAVLICFLSSLVLAKETGYSRGKSYGYTKSVPSSGEERGSLTFQEGSILANQSATKKKELTLLQQEARLYRQEGLEFQKMGRIDDALAAYQKAIAADPNYVEPYNDLGVVYELKGWQDKAIEAYEKTLELEPSYLAAYSNLAAVYEQKGDLKTAAIYWKKRIKYGLADDYWTQKAMQRREEIGMIIKEVGKELKEEKVVDLIQEVIVTKPAVEQAPREQLSDKQQQAIAYLTSARLKLQRGETYAALTDAGIAKHLDPSNTQIDEFIEQVHEKLISIHNR
jgi:tetratricopeptide (TPR) repeat protein